MTSKGTHSPTETISASVPAATYTSDGLRAPVRVCSIHTFVWWYAT